MRRKTIVAGLLLSFTLSTSLLPSAELFYRFTPKIEEKVIAVELTFQSGDSSITELLLPTSYTGDICQEVENLHIFCSTGELFSQDDDSAEILKIAHKPQEEIRVTYELRPPIDTRGYRTVVFDEAELFRFAGDVAFVVPHWDFYEEHSITLDWHDIPSNWAIANSFGVHENKQRLDISFSNLLRGLYLGGGLVITQTGGVENPPYVALKTSGIPNQDTLLPILEKTVQCQREFWGDNDFSNFLITLLPSDSEHGIQAEAKLNAFEICFPPYSDHEEQWQTFTWVLTHEHFHTWNPYKMLPRIPNDFPSLAWFTEGFTEYYTAVLCYRAQTLSADRCVEEVNRLLKGYYKSAARNFPNEQLKNPWDDPQKVLMPYQRGSILALLWDYEIHQRSEGKFSLDHAMRLLLRRLQESGEPISQSAIEECVGEYLGIQASIDIQNFIIEGNTITPPEYLFGKDHKIEWSTDDIGNSVPQFE